MIQCFLGSFVFGFLGTAMPRMLGTPPLSKRETSLAILLILGTTIAHTWGKSLIGHTFFLLLLLIFPAFMINRFKERQDTPPPGFALVLLGWISAVVGTVIPLASQLGHLPATAIRLGQILLHQGFLFFPILGIGAFLFPRFFGLLNPHDLEESRVPPKRWYRLAVLALAIGLAAMIGFVLEAMGHLRVGPMIRLIAAGLYLSREVPFMRTLRKHGTLGLSLGMALYLFLGGMAAIAIFPPYFKAMEHILFMGGFGLLALTVATRVITGHSGQSHLFKARLPSMIALIAIIIVSLLTRISSDVFPQVIISHHVYAAILWTIGCAIWGFRWLPHVLVEEKE